MPAHRWPCIWIGTATGVHCRDCGRPRPREPIVIRILEPFTWPALVICDLRARAGDVPVVLAGPFPTMAKLREAMPSYLLSDADPCCLANIDEDVFRLLLSNGPAARALLTAVSTQHYLPDGTPISCCDRARLRELAHPALVAQSGALLVGELVRDEAVPA